MVAGCFDLIKSCAVTMSTMSTMSTRGQSFYVGVEKLLPGSGIKNVIGQSLEGVPCLPMRCME